MGSQARAGTVTIAVDLGGTVIYSTIGAVNITAVNTDLGDAGSAYRFATNGLTASASSTATDDVSLATTASITISSTGSTTPTLSIDVVATGILSPTGVGTLFSSASGTYTTVASGTTEFTGDYQTTVTTPTIVGTASGGSTSYSSSNPGRLSDRLLRATNCRTTSSLA